MSSGSKSLMDVELRADWQILAPFFQEQMAWLSRVVASRNLGAQGDKSLDAVALGLGINAGLIMLYRMWCTRRLPNFLPFLPSRHLLLAPPEEVLNGGARSPGESRVQPLSESNPLSLPLHEHDLGPSPPPPLLLHGVPLSQASAEMTDSVSLAPTPDADANAMPPAPRDPAASSNDAVPIDQIDINAIRAGTEAILGELALSNHINAELRMTIQDLEGRLQRVQQHFEQRLRDLEQRLQAEQQAKLEAEAALQAAHASSSRWQQERDTLQAALNAMEVEHENVLVALYELEMEKHSQDSRLRELESTLRQVRLDKVQEVATLKSKIEEPTPLQRKARSAYKLPFPVQQTPTSSLGKEASGSSSSRPRRAMTPQRAGWKSKSLFSSPTSVARQYSPTESFPF